MKKRNTFVLILSLLVIAGVSAVYVYPILNPVHVDASRVERGNLYLTVKAPGQVGPKDLVPVLAPASAKVVSVAVSLGQEVKEGDVLMDIEVAGSESDPAPSASPPAATVSPTAPSLPPATRTPAPASPTPPSQPTPRPIQPAPSPSPAPTQPAPSPAPTQPPRSPSPAPTPSSPSPSPVPTPTAPSESPAQLVPSPAPTQSAPSPSPAPSIESTRPVPSPTPPAAPSATPTPAPSASYTVQSGDTLSAIAQQNGTTVEEIARANGISNPNLIYPGQQLTIPQGRPGQGGPSAAPLAEKSRLATSITSPIDGQVVKLEVRADQLVAPEASLAIIADTSSLYLEILVDEGDLAEISKGQSAQTVLDALPKETVRGKVEEINRTPVTGPAGTSSYSVKVGLAAPPKGIRLGMTGQAEIVTKQLTGVLFIPKRAVLEGQGEARVFVIEGNQVQEAVVTVGGKTRDYYEITGGLIEGQQVVVTGLDELSEGRRVAVDRVLSPK